MGGDIEEFPDGFHISGRERLKGGEVDARHDHRLAMAFAIAALGASGPTVIHDAGAAAVSYPEFFLRPRITARVKADKLYLVGFMGAGKTTVARALGKRTGWRVEDIDQRIEAREHRSVASIFSQQSHTFPATRADGARRAAAAAARGRRHGWGHVRRGGQSGADAGRWRGGVAGPAIGAGDRARAGRWTTAACLGSRADGAACARRQLAYAHAHVRIDATRPVAEVVGRLLEWVDF